MTNLSDLFPAGAGKQVSFTADGNISAAGKPVILTAAGKAAPVAATAASMGTAADAGTGYRAGYTSGAAYHSTNNSTVLCFPDSANSYYATCTTATLSGTTMTMNTPTVINSTACHFVRCAYDATQNRVVFFYKYNGSGNYGKARAASVSGSTFTFGTEENAFSNNALGNNEGDICNLDDSKVALCWGSVTSLTGANVEVVSISGSSLSFGTEASVSSNTSLPMRMASGKKGELLCQLGYSSHIQYVACTVSGTTVTAGTVTEISGGSSTINDVASGFWAGYTSPESTYVAVYQTPGGGTDAMLGRVITVSGTTLTLNSTTALSLEASSNYPAMGWGGSSTQALFYYRDDAATSFGRVTEIDYAGTTVSEGTTVTVGTSMYANWGVAWDQTAEKSIVMYQDAGNSDAAAVNVFSPGSTNLTAADLLGISDAAISDTASGNVTIKGGIAVNGLSSLTPGTDYYAQGDGTISTSSSGDAVKLGKALSATSINLEYQS